MTQLVNKSISWTSNFQKSISLMMVLFAMVFVGHSQTQVTMNMVWVGSTATTADFDVILINTGSTSLKFNGVIVRGNHAANLTTAGATITWNALNNNPDPAWANGTGSSWPNITANLPYTPATRLLNYSSNNVFFTNLTAPTIPGGAGVNIGRFRINVSGGTWLPNGEFGFVWATTAAVIAYVNGATTTTSLNAGAGNIVKNVPVTQPLNTVAVGSTSAILSGAATICAGSSTNLSVAITGGTSPYTLQYSDGTNTTTINNYVSGTAIPVSPSATTTYNIISIYDAGGLFGIGNSGTPTVTVNPIVTPTFAGVPASICSGASLTLPTTSDNGIGGTWSPAINNTATTIYTFTPNVGACATGPVTKTVIVNPIVTPTFNPIAAICAGGSFTLPTTSTNGITGTWSPANNNTTTTTYTFTPSAGQCATTAPLTVTVTPNVTPTFTPIAGICTGGTFTLPTTSNNGITGTWSPAINNTTTTTYTFTPTAGQCATTASLTVGVSAPTTPTFTQIAPICVGGTFTLPTTSNNGITGSWSPAINNQIGTLYTFTPNPGQCAGNATMTVSVTQLATPFFTQIAPVCPGTSYTLPTTSTTGITGTWSPAINPNANTTYTFTPTAGQCAATTTMTVNIISLPAPQNVLAINVQAVTATVSWNAMSLPAGGFFTVQYRPVGSPTWITAGNPNASATTFGLTGLAQGTAYECRVRANCSATSAGPWSSSNFFTTITSPCNTPLVLVNGGNTGNSVTVTWTAIPGAAWYEFEYKATSSSVWISAGTLPGSSTSKIFTGLNPNTSYDFRSRTYCPNNTNSPWSTTLTVVTNPLNGCSLPPPVVAAAVLGTSATMSWTTVPGVAYYEFRYKPAASTTWISGGTATAVEVTKNIVGLTTNTLYDFEGRSFCPNGVPSAWGAMQFTTTGLTGCELPAVLNPTATTTSGSIDVTWTAVAGATLYEFQYKLTSSGTWLPGGTVAGSATSKLFNGLLNNTSYDFQIRTYCASGVVSAWSATESYTTDISLVGLDENSTDFNIAIVYPNPTSGNLSIKINLKEASSSTSFELTDMAGRVVMTQAENSVIGVNEFQLDLVNLSRGMYTLKIFDDARLLQITQVNKN